MKNFCTLLVMFTAASSFSQSWSWSNSGSFSSSLTNLNTVTSDISGNSYISGASSGGVFLIKYDANGNLSWQKYYGGGYGSVTSLCTDHPGNLYSVFWATSVEGVTYDPALGAVLFAKFDPSGNLIWIRQISYRLLLSERPADNQIIGTGTFTETVYLENGDTLTVPPGSAKPFMAQYDLNGDCNWSQQDDGGRYPLAVNDSREMFAAGEVKWGTTVGQDSNVVMLYPPNGYSYFAKYDSIGALKWVLQGSGSFTGDNFGNGYVATGVGNNLYLKKYNASGNFLWQRTHFYSPSWGKYKMKCDAHGNILFTGGFSNSLTIDDTTITVSGSEAFVAKIDSSGVLQWVTVTSGSGSAGAKDISIGDDGAIFITGDMSGSVSFGPHTVTESSGVFVAKLLDVNVTGIKENPEASTSFSISPNPGSGIFQLSYSADEASKVRIEIHNATGQLIWSGREEAVKTFTKSVDLSEQPKGIYFVQVTGEKNRSVKKIVKQ